MSPRFLRALEYCKLWHGNQVRKYTGEPYFLHPLEVAEILGRVTENPETLIAGLFHDVFEDTPTTVDTVNHLFGPRVVELVLEVTDISRPEDGNRDKRKRIDREHLANASEAGMNIKLADLISNSHDIVKNDPDFAVVYLCEKKLLLKVLTNGHQDLVKMAYRQLDAGFLKLREMGKI
jgi:(p)ppGpp synthase/HD superfamily hydrolase